VSEKKMCCFARTLYLSQYICRDWMRRELYRKTRLVQDKFSKKWRGGADGGGGGLIKVE
jgi:hypothetical protein